MLGEYVGTVHSSYAIYNYACVPTEWRNLRYLILGILYSEAISNMLPWRPHCLSARTTRFVYDALAGVVVDVRKLEVSNDI